MPLFVHQNPGPIEWRWHLSDTFVASLSAKSALPRLEDASWLLQLRPAEILLGPSINYITHEGGGGFLPSVTKAYQEGGGYGYTVTLQKRHLILVLYAVDEIKNANVLENCEYQHEAILFKLVVFTNFTVATIMAHLRQNKSRSRAFGFTFKRHFRKPFFPLEALVCRCSLSGVQCRITASTGLRVD